MKFSQLLIIYLVLTTFWAVFVWQFRNIFTQEIFTRPLKPKPPKKKTKEWLYELFIGPKGIVPILGLISTILIALFLF